MRVLVIIIAVIVVVIVTWESKANSSSSLTELQTGTELGKKNGVFSGHYVIASSLPPE